MVAEVEGLTARSLDLATLLYSSGIAGMDSVKVLSGGVDMGSVKALVSDVDKGWVKVHGSGVDMGWAKALGDDVDTVAVAQVRQRGTVCADWETGRGSFHAVLETQLSDDYIAASGLD
jgi:hypothetical protein